MSICPQGHSGLCKIWAHRLLLLVLSLVWTQQVGAVEMIFRQVEPRGGNGLGEMKLGGQTTSVQDVSPSPILECWGRSGRV